MVLDVGCWILFDLSTLPIWGVDCSGFLMFLASSRISVGGQLGRFGHQWLHFDHVCLVIIMVMGVGCWILFDLSTLPIWGGDCNTILMFPASGRISVRGGLARFGQQLLVFGHISLVIIMVMGVGCWILFHLSTLPIWGVDCNAIFVLPSSGYISSGGQHGHFGTVGCILALFA